MFSIHEIANFNKWEQDGNKLRVRLGHGLVVSLSTCAVFGDTSEWDEDFGRSTPFFNLFPTMKKIFTLILLSMIAFNAIHAEVTWTLSDDGTLTISGTEMPDYGSPDDVPWRSQTKKIKKVVIENGVTNIGGLAFYECSNLSSITIPNSVTSIGTYAFDYCSGLTAITIPEAVTNIGNGVFYGCSGLTSIIIPESVTSIGESAFENCSALTSVKIPNSVTSIGKRAFENCSVLTSITIPEFVTSIEWHAFYGAKLRNIMIKAKTPPLSGENTFNGQSYYHTTLMIPEGCWDAYAYDNYWYKFINIREMAYNAVNLTNSKAYTMKSATEGSYLFYDSVNDCVGTLSETAFDDTEENNTWMTVEVDGKNYVYNLGAKKFLVSDKNASKTGYSLSNTPVSIDIEDGKDAIGFGKGKEFYMVINEKLNVYENLETQIMTSTGINEIDVESNKPTVTYNLSGQRINRSHVLNGVYIKNGKKVIVK